MGMPYWKRSLLPLLLVNRSFFNAASGQLWKDMHSFLPFAKLLPSVYGTPILQTRCVNANGQEDIWSRFMLYSSYTSNLVLPYYDLDGKDGPWVSYLLGTASRPKHIFPRLRTLDVYGADLTTCALLPILAGQLRGCQVLNEVGLHLTFVRFAVATLASKAESISTLRIEGPMLPGTMAYIANMCRLRDLIISSKPDPLEMHMKDFLNLKSVPGLKRLALDYVVPTTGNVFTENYAPDIEECLKEDAHLPALEELLVSGDGLTQHMVARDVLLPKTLRRLDLICRETGVRGHLIPFALRVYLERNQNLERLNIKWEYDPRTRYGHAAKNPRVQFFSNNPLYKDMSSQFLPALARQTSLTELKIDGLGCFKDSLTEQICDIIPNFPNLKKLTLRPTFKLYGNSPGFPPFTVLESIANSCPLLEWISMPISWTNPISLPERIPTSPHKLTRLWIGGGHHPEDLRGSIAIGRYLHTLFPRLRHLCDPSGGVHTQYKEDRGGVGVNPNLWDAMDAPAVRSDDPIGRGEYFWKEIEVLVGSYHEARAQAIRELSLQ
ncbi:hypothetical protein DFP72DRAFT_209482 [Ephemerocybe angulata]|uniref:Uncharacterized protein n=1 Tax=Ephemerocybe angulata TaxID=980116 RepID=A0A8H6I4W2_9AGAR|nr:hypothetical protein DFP72DRAFT_209482 [Tulosesus angulatus]